MDGISQRRASAEQPVVSLQTTKWINVMFSSRKEHKTKLFHLAGQHGTIIKLWQGNCLLYGKTCWINILFLYHTFSRFWHESVGLAFKFKAKVNIAKLWKFSILTLFLSHGRRHHVGKKNQGKGQSDCSCCKLHCQFKMLWKLDSSLFIFSEASSLHSTLLIGHCSNIPCYMYPMYSYS